MNELELLTTLRDEVPLAPPSPAAERLVLAGIGRSSPRVSTAPRPARPQHRRLRMGLAGLVAVVACAAGAVVVIAVRAAKPGLERQSVAWSGRPTAPLPDLAHPSVGRAGTETQLVDYATRAAAASPGPAPTGNEWVFVKTEIADSSAGSGGFLFGPPDERIDALQWYRVDGTEIAGLPNFPATLSPSVVVHSQLGFTHSGGGTIGGWKSVSYSYLNSLPTDPPQLESVIFADNLPSMPWYSTPDNVAIFNAIGNLLQSQTDGVWIPPKLAAAMYQVLEQLPGVHFDSGTDLAGRSGIGLYMVIDGWYKQEFVINPVTYTYMGEESVATQAHVDEATDGTRYIKQGQVLGWEALLSAAIVQQPGQLP